MGFGVLRCSREKNPDDILCEIDSSENFLSDLKLNGNEILGFFCFYRDAKTTEQRNFAKLFGEKSPKTVLRLNKKWSFDKSYEDRENQETPTQQELKWLKYFIEGRVLEAQSSNNFVKNAIFKIVWQKKQRIRNSSPNVF